MFSKAPRQFLGILPGALAICKNIRKTTPNIRLYNCASVVNTWIIAKMSDSTNYVYICGVYFTVGWSVHEEETITSLKCICAGQIRFPTGLICMQWKGNSGCCTSMEQWNIFGASTIKVWSCMRLIVCCGPFWRNWALPTVFQMEYVPHDSS